MRPNGPFRSSCGRSLYLPAAAANTSGMDEFVRPPEQTVKMAVIVIATAPILCVYPFLQKHFAKGAAAGIHQGIERAKVGVGKETICANHCRQLCGPVDHPGRRGLHDAFLLQADARARYLAFARFAQLEPSWRAHYEGMCGRRIS